jgi:hypothetical protein
MTTPNEISGDKKGDTANTVQVIDCNSISDARKIPASSGLPPAMLTLIDILARQAAREICNPKNGEQE